jgi:predicted 2-oxoglutarate/Fe(II)-dependent dioxygenase YbiX
MRPITTSLAALLSTVSRSGDFFVSGRVEIFAPRLEVDGVGPIALPLLPAQAGELIAVAERAPYGRGEETLVDTSVRRTWQIGADRVRLGGRHWAQTQDTILARVAEGLGVSEPIRAELYKLLVYDQGSFFVSHRDTEKAPGMFATLVVTLPSVSAGGELMVRHKGREVRLDLHCDEPSEAAFAAFYCDCVHEVLPVTSGCRLAMVYNLVRNEKELPVKPPDYEREQTRAAALLRAWAADTPSPGASDPPAKLVYPLEHAYTPAELGFGALKGTDAAVARVLGVAAPQAGCDLHLALLSIGEYGAAEYTGDFGSRSRWSEPELEAGEIIDRYMSLSEWRLPDGSRPTLGELPVYEEEFAPPDALDDMEPDEEEFHEATGNEGASFERTYRRAALALWPRARVLLVMSQAGLQATLPLLSELTKRWLADGGERQSPFWSQAHELSGYMISEWRGHGWYPDDYDDHDENEEAERDEDDDSDADKDDKTPSAVARMLFLLARLEDTIRLDSFLSDIVGRGQFERGDFESILGALGLLPAERAAVVMEHVIAGAGDRSLGTCAALMAHAAAAPPHGRRLDLVGAATRLVEALPGGPERTQRDPWQQRRGIKSGFVVDLCAALVSIDPALAERAVDHMLAWPNVFGLDTILNPAARDLIGAPATNNSAAVQRLRAACVDHLRRRIAEPLEAPPDWRRASAVQCRCPRCKELSSFLADPACKIWSLKAPEADRAHVEATIRHAGCDLDVTTDQRGRPYTLVCTKNSASYDRRVKQRRKDLDDLARLDAESTSQRH